MFFPGICKCYYWLVSSPAKFGRCWVVVCAGWFFIECWPPFANVVPTILLWGKRGKGPRGDGEHQSNFPFLNRVAELQVSSIFWCGMAWTRLHFACALSKLLIHPVVEGIHADPFPRTSHLFTRWCPPQLVCPAHSHPLYDYDVHRPS